MTISNKFKLLGLITITVLAGCSAKSKTGEANEKVKTVNVRTEAIQPQSFERYVRLVGTVETENDVKISAEVSGRIVRYYVQQGEYVEEGEAILKINDDELQAKQAQLEAQTLAAKEKYQRLKRIFRQDSIGSEMNVIQAKTNYLQSKAALTQVTVALQNTTVRAPFSGIVDDRIAEVGEMATPGMPLVRLIGTGNLRITGGVPSRYANVVSTGNKAKVWFNFQPNDTLTLPITYVSKSINPESRTFEIQITLPSDTTNYKVDMIANVKLQTFHQDSAVVVGMEHIYPGEEGFVAYTLAQNSRNRPIAVRQPVQVGATYNNRTLIKSGLDFGDTLITVGSAFLQDSMRVTVINNDQNLENLNQNTLKNSAESAESAG